MSRKLTLPVFVCSLAWVTAACPKDDRDHDPAPNFDCTAMLANVADNVILPTLRDFDDATGALVTACEGWAAQSPPAAGSEVRAAVQAAWVSAMDLWQEAEMMQLGPAGVMGVAMGGADMRDDIYSWPTINACAVDQQVVANEFREDGYLDRKLVDVSGLDALEYLAFVDGEGNACPGPSTINSEGKWAALSSDQIWQRRADYCVAAAKHLSGNARELRDAWEPAGGDFRGKLVNAGEQGSVYESPAEAMDALYAALFYLELKVKDRKLAVPAGLHVDCTAESCPQLVESRYARRSKEHIAANLRAFEKLFLGKATPDGEDGSGFDDFLIAANATQLAERMTRELTNAQAAVAAFEGSLEDALVSDVERVRALHGALKVVTDDLKSQMPSVLGLRVPQEGAGDND